MKMREQVRTASNLLTNLLGDDSGIKFKKLYYELGDPDLNLTMRQSYKLKNRFLRSALGVLDERRRWPAEDYLAAVKYFYVDADPEIIVKNFENNRNGFEYCRLVGSARLWYDVLQGQVMQVLTPHPSTWAGGTQDTELATTKARLYELTMGLSETENGLPAAKITELGMLCELIQEYEELHGPIGVMADIGTASGKSFEPLLQEHSRLDLVILNDVNGPFLDESYQRNSQYSDHTVAIKSVFDRLWERMSRKKIFNYMEDISSPRIALLMGEIAGNELPNRVIEELLPVLMRFDAVFVTEKVTPESLLKAPEITNLFAGNRGKIISVNYRRHAQDTMKHYEAHGNEIEQLMKLNMIPYCSDPKDCLKGYSIRHTIGWLLESPGALHPLDEIMSSPLQHIAYEEGMPISSYFALLEGSRMPSRYPIPLGIEYKGKNISVFGWPSSRLSIQQKKKMYAKTGLYVGSLRTKQVPSNGDILAVFQLIPSPALARLYAR